MKNLKFLAFIISLIVASAILFVSLPNKQPTFAANCFGVSGSVNVTSATAWQPSSVTISCPGRPGLCPGDSQTIPGSGGGFSLSNCNCLVASGCLSVTTNGGRLCSITNGPFCYSNTSGNVSGVGVNITCQAPLRYNCVNPFTHTCQDDRGNNTGTYADPITCANSTECNPK